MPPARREPSRSRLELEEFKVEGTNDSERTRDNFVIKFLRLGH